MKNDLPFFSHDNNARNHPKMKALIAEYGYEGYGRFWALNEKIAETSGAFINISKKINRLALANELNFDGNELDKFLEFLSDPEIDLINIKDNKITTDRISESYKAVINKREKQRKNKQSIDNEEIDSDFNKINSDNEEIDSDFNTEENRIEENKKEKNNNGSAEPPASFSQALELSTLILTSHRKEFPDYLSGKTKSEIEKKLEGWAKDIELLIRRDKKDPEIIRQVILWVKKPGNFWFQNIESGAKLRKQFERLYGEMTAKPKETSPPERMSYIPSFEESERRMAEFEESRKNAVTGVSLAEDLKKILKEKQEGLGVKRH
jgi:hypothetical protein